MKEQPHKPGHSKEYQEQLAITAIARKRFPTATGIKEIKPFLMTDEKADNWLVILTTKEEFIFQTTLVTGEDIQKFQMEQQEKNNP